MNTIKRAIWYLSLALLVVTAMPREGTAATYVIGPGHEEEILGLVAPRQFGDEIHPGWELGRISIDGEAVVIELLGSDGAATELRALHPSESDSDVRSPSFAYELGSPTEPGYEARQALAQLVSGNDQNLDLWSMTESARRLGADTVEPTSATNWYIVLFGVFLAVSFALPWFIRRRSGASPAPAGAQSADVGAPGSEELAGGAEQVDVADDSDEVARGGVDDGEGADAVRDQ